MRNDKESSAMTPDPPQGDLSQDEREKAAGKAGRKPPLAQPPEGEESLAETGQVQVQSRGKPQTQPQE